jgi:signal transduction histidine kinase
MAHCPAYQGPICSLCCTLDARCGDLCKPHASLATQWSAVLRWWLPGRLWPYLDNGLASFLLLMAVTVPLLASVFGLLYAHELRALTAVFSTMEVMEATQTALRSGFLKAFMLLLLIAGLVAWWVVLAHKSRQVAQDESNRQTQLLLREIELHRKTDEALQHAKQVADQARAAADQANQAKSRYISAISHELRTPLNSILGFSDVLGSIDSLDDKQRRYVENIRSSGRMLLEMINDILDLAKIEAGKMEVRPTVFPLEAVVAAQGDMVRPLAERKRIDLAWTVEPGLEAVEQDQAKVQQILANLLSNAVKFTPEGGSVAVAASVDADASDAFLVEVTDTGVGIAEEEQQAIFEKFRQGRRLSGGDDAMTREFSGTGLGLSIVRELCRLLGGDVTVTSQLGRGSRFTVRLPRRLSTETAGGEAARPEPATAAGAVA